MTPEPVADEPGDPVANGHPATNGNAVRINGGAVKVDGHAVRLDVDELDAPEADVAPITSLEDVTWRPSYDRESVDRYLAAVEAEKARLLAEIRAAEERTAAAQERYQENAAERDALLGELLLAARAEIDRVDTDHRTTVAAITAAAEEEATRLRDRAQADAAAVRDVVASLTGLTSPGEDDERRGD